MIGANGSGKSSLFRSWPASTTGSPVKLASPRGSRLATYRRSPLLDPSKDVAGNVTDGVAEIKTLLDRFEEVCTAMGEPDADFDKLLAEQAQLQDRSTPPTPGTWTASSRSPWTPCGCRRATPTSTTLSGGERRRVALCRLLLAEPDLLLLDEPTNHLDAESVAWLERHLKEYPGTVVAVTHDRYFLDNVAEWILELDRGLGIPWKGNYSSWLEQKQARLAGEEKADRARQRTLWPASSSGCGMSPRARQSKSKARITAYNALVAEAEDAAGSERGDKLEISIPPGRTWATWWSRPESVSKGFGDNLLIEDLSFLLPPGGIVGVIGPNGAGKTTLFRMIVGQEKPDAGELRSRRTVRLAYVDQTRDDPDRRPTPSSRRSPAARIASWSAGRELHGRAYAGQLQLQGAATSRSKVGELSGGERNRVHLAKLLRSGGNLLLLDEPTNDLDVDTLRALEDALLAFRRLRRGHQPRPLVPGPHRHPHPGLRGRLQVRWCEGNSRTTRPTASSAWASTPTSRTASATSRWSEAEIGAGLPSARHRGRLRCPHWR